MRRLIVLFTLLPWVHGSCPVPSPIDATRLEPVIEDFKGYALANSEIKPVVLKTVGPKSSLDCGSGIAFMTWGTADVIVTIQITEYICNETTGQWQNNKAVILRKEHFVSCLMPERDTDADRFQMCSTKLIYENVTIDGPIVRAKCPTGKHLVAIVGGLEQAGWVYRCSYGLEFDLNGQSERNVERVFCRDVPVPVCPVPERVPPVKYGNHPTIVAYGGKETAESYSFFEENGKVRIATVTPDELVLSTADTSSIMINHAYGTELVCNSQTKRWESGSYIHPENTQISRIKTNKIEFRVNGVVCKFLINGQPFFVLKFEPSVGQSMNIFTYPRAPEEYDDEISNSVVSDEDYEVPPMLNATFSTLECIFGAEHASPTIRLFDGRNRSDIGNVHHIEVSGATQLQPSHSGDCSEIRELYVRVVDFYANSLISGMTRYCMCSCDRYYSPNPPPLVLDSGEKHSSATFTERVPRRRHKMERVGQSSPTKRCLICSVPIRFSRLGVHACRACAAFFKRSKISGIQLRCRQGHNRCAFRKHEKFMCRSCRFDKCVELGMEYSPVEKNNEQWEVAKEEEIDEVNEASPSIEIKDQSLLEAMRIAYENSHAKRLAEEQEIVKRHRLKRFEHPTEDLYVSSLHSFNEMFPSIIKEIVSMFEQVFPFLQEFIIEDKAALFQDFIGKFAMVEGLYRTFMYDIKTNHHYVSLITLIDCDNVDQWVRDEDWMERKGDCRGFVKHYAEEYDTLLLPLFNIEKFTQREFMALLILGFCDIDLSLDLPEFIFDKLAAIRKSVFLELQEYYNVVEMCGDISRRMGQLMTIAHSTSEAGLLMNEEFRTYAALFDVYSGDFLLREIFFQ